jgi:HAMP domain-containing protein
MELSAELSEPSRRRRFYVHPMQRRSAWLVGAGLFVYSLSVAGMVLLAPFVPAALRVQGPAEGPQYAQALREYIVLTEAMSTSLPLVLLLIPAAAVFSIVLTHRVAGPIYRLERIASDLSEGRLPRRIRFRKRDELGELAALLNRGFGRIDVVVSDVRSETSLARTDLCEALARLEDRLGSDDPAVERITRALGGVERALEAAERLELADDGVPRDPPRDTMS